MRSRRVENLIRVAILVALTACAETPDSERSTDEDSPSAAHASPVTLATYVGGSALDDCDDITVDRDGNILLGCHVWSTDFPGLPPGTEPRGDTRAAVVKLDPQGTVLWTRFVDGTHWDGYFAITTDPSGNVYAAGTAESPDVPTTEGVVQPAFGGGETDCLITKLSPSGEVMFTTYLGGSEADGCSGIAIDRSGDVYVAGDTESTDFPTGDGALAPDSDTTSPSGSRNAFVTRLSADASELVYSVLLGGEATDRAAGLALDGDGNAVVAGLTESPDFPASSALQATPGGGGDAFVVKVSPSGSLVWATYLGGSMEDIGLDVSVDSGDNVYVAGITQSEDFPLASPLQGELAGRGDAFLAKLAPDGSRLVYSTYLGGRGEEFWTSLEVDAEGRAVLLVSSGSTDFPIRNPVQRSPGGGSRDMVIAKLDAAGTALVYSTFYGGSDNDGGEGLALGPDGAAYVSGYTHSVDFPLVRPVQAVFAGDWDVPIVRIADPDPAAPDGGANTGGRAPVGWEIVDLGTLGGESSFARTIDEKGRVVGESATEAGERHAFLWTREDGMMDLGTFADDFFSSAWGVSAAGIVGQSVGPSFSPVIWRDGEVAKLGDLEGWYNVVAAINDAGQAAGWSLVGTSWDTHAVRWTTVGGASDSLDLTVLGAASRGLRMDKDPEHRRSGSSRAWAINEAGAIAGESETMSGATHAFVRLPDADMQDLGTLGGRTSRAFDLDDSGRVVGESLTATGDRHAFLWEPGQGMKDLGTLGGQHSSALGLSSEGVVVGYSYTADGTRRAFVWTEREGMHELGTLGGAASLARGINVRGEIVGESLRTDGTRRAVLWREVSGG